ncbi:MAG: hypothetical protein COB49_07455 [Alphaproteobacteria bacterium]|nr:MAG: hypothetical protein COB49_07455 [Alphaproteobacteria bacterium]
MTQITTENLSTQTQNYWQACQWLADDKTTQEKKDHAIAILRAIANYPDLGDLAEIAEQTLENNNVILVKFPLWQGTRP